MKNNCSPTHIAHILICVLCAAMVLTTFVSWVMATAGLDVASLLTAEALRWMFVRQDMGLTTTRGHCVLMLVWLIGGIMRVLRGIPGSRDFLHRQAQQPNSRTAAGWGGATFVVLLTLLALLIFPANAPLKSVVGLVWPSPYMLVQLRVLVFITLVALAVYGLVRGTLRDLGDFLSVFYYGFARLAPWLLVWILTELYISILNYVFG